MNNPKKSNPIVSLITQLSFLKNIKISNYQDLLHFIADMKILPAGVNANLRDLSLNGKINTIIAISAMPIFILLLIAFAMFTIQQSNQIDKVMTDSTISTSNVFRYYESQAVMYANTFANNAVVQSQLLNSTPNSGPVVRAGETIKRSADIDQLTVYDKHGVVVSRVHAPIRLGDDQSKLEYVKSAIELGKSSRMIVMDDGKYVLQGIVPVVFEGEIVGAVSAGYELNTSFASRLFKLTQTHLFLMVNDGLIASSMGTVRIPEGQGAPLYEDRNIDSSKLRDIVLWKSGVKVKTTEYDFRFVSVDTPLRDEQIKSIGLIIVMDQSSPRFWLYILLFGFVMTSLVIIFIALVIALKIAKNIGRSVSRIDEGLSSIAKGDLTTQIEIVSKDELGKLAGAFNNMVVDLDSSYRSLEEAKQKIQEYADHLEEKVKERTRELQKTLEEIQLLKEHQDGDYFLTSLLTDPLTSNTLSRGLRIKGDYRLIQKKKFQFRKWDRELGGDLCMIHELNLNQRSHVFFLNADAMGKSLQGAGGILVMGSVLKSIIERNQLEISNHKVYPEIWLKNTFIELHKVFESFSGSMLVSLAMGLIDSATGNMYYINAEHPWTALYRDGKASFIEDELLYRKLGTQSVDGAVTILMHKLEPGDIIIAGSDGRDDLLLDVVDGVRVLNEDETLFLKSIEESKTDLDVLVKKLKSIGEVTDDLSMLKVEFYPQENIRPKPLSFDGLEGELSGRWDAIYSRLRSRSITPSELVFQVKEVMAGMDVSHAADCIKDLLTAIPSDLNFVTAISELLYTVDATKDFIEQAERIRALDMNNHDNLMKLCEAYFRVGETKKSQNLIHRMEQGGVEELKLQGLKTMMAVLNKT
jgi:HAMP domain-containing protein